MTTLLMAALLIFGAFGYATLPVGEAAERRLPVRFRCRRVCRAPIRRRWRPQWHAAGKPVFDHRRCNIPMTSSSSQGSTQHHSQVRSGCRNIDGAAEDVQSAIQAASRQLPTNLPSPPTLRKVNPSDSGNSIYLVMQSPGVTVYPARQIYGKPFWRSEFQRSPITRRLMSTVPKSMPRACKSILSRWRRAESGSIKLPRQYRARTSTLPPVS